MLVKLNLINSQNKFKTSMIKPTLCEYSDAYICIHDVKGTITIAHTGTAEALNNIRKNNKNCAPFTDWISKLNNTQVDNAKDIDVVMPMHNLIDYIFTIKVPLQD